MSCPFYPQEPFTTPECDPTDQRAFRTGLETISTRLPRVVQPPPSLCQESTQRAQPEKYAKIWLSSRVLANPDVSTEMNQVRAPAASKD
jgi:hypothetical protein